MEYLIHFLDSKGYKHDNLVYFYKYKDDIKIEVNLDKDISIKATNINTGESIEKLIRSIHIDIYSSDCLSIFKYELVKLLYELNENI